jgi:hypothetical protein
MTKKSIYLTRIRDDSAYPAFRKLVNFFAFITYIGGGLAILSGLMRIGNLVTMLSIKSMDSRLYSEVMVACISPFVFGLVAIIIAMVSKEASLMLADIADSITDFNSRSEERTLNPSTFVPNVPNAPPIMPTKPPTRNLW